MDDWSPQKDHAYVYEVYLTTILILFLTRRRKCQKTKLFSDGDLVLGSVVLMISFKPGNGSLCAPLQRGNRSAYGRPRPFPPLPLPLWQLVVRRARVAPPLSAGGSAPPQPHPLLRAPVQHRCWYYKLRSIIITCYYNLVVIFITRLLLCINITLAFWRHNNVIIA